MYKLMNTNIAMSKIPMGALKGANKTKLFLGVLAVTGWFVFCSMLIPDVVSANPKESSSYVIGSSDEINITVLGYPELSTQTVVLPDGTISFPYLGRVKAADEDIEMLTKSLQTSLDAYIYNPNVTISLVNMNSKRFSVLGDVNSPGMFSLGVTNMTIYEAIAQAGGFLPTAYSQKVRIMRADSLGQQKIINLDLNRALGQLDGSNITIRPGDVVYVPGRTNIANRFSVLGEVQRPGVFPMKDMNITIYEAIAQAQGFRPTAYKKQVNILREDEDGYTTSLNVDLDGAGMSLSDDLRLKLSPGDIVYVPGQSDSKQVSVIGKVAVPGRYNFDLGMTVVDVLTAAGWITDEGVPTSVMLVRRKADDAQFRRINTRNIIKKGDFSQDVTLEPGDIIYVPERFISKLSTFTRFFTSTIEPMASTYLRVYDATNPATQIIDR